MKWVATPLVIEQFTVNGRQCEPEVPSRKRDRVRLIGVGSVRSQDLLCGAEDAPFEKWAGNPSPDRLRRSPSPAKGRGLRVCWSQWIGPDEAFPQGGEGCGRPALRI